MELKLAKFKNGGAILEVLIVPSGIETTMQIINQLSFHDVLIVPSGIETPKVVVCAFGDIKVLIVPSGIETYLRGAVAHGGNVLIVPSGIETTKFG